jgi:putative SOS response-associated peptidase YedK
VAVVRLCGLPADTPEVEPQYNIAPTTFIPVVRESSADVAATRRLAMMYWGLVPAWARDKSMGARMINARAETLNEKPAFREAFRRRRGLVPADGYFEWMQVGARDTQPYFIQPAGNRHVEDLARFFAPHAAGELVATPVSRRVSSARNQGPECIEPLAVETPGLPFDLVPPAGGDDQ